MERYIISAQLKPRKTAAAEQQLATGPPFDPADVGLLRHAAYLSADRVFLVFEAETARTTALKLARDHLVEVSRWQEIVSGLPSSVEEVPHDARCVYEWTADPLPQKDTVRSEN